MRIGTRLAALAMVGIGVCGAAQSQPQGRTEEVRVEIGRPAATLTEKELFLAVNEARQTQGLPPLRWNESLATAARRHAVVMAQHGSAQHGFEDEPSLSVRVKQTGAHFSWLSENVTQGPKAEFIHSQFMKSPSHRANILDADMNSIGIGVVELGGQFYTVEDFANVK